MPQLWSDLYKLFVLAWRSDPITKKNRERELEGVGVTQPDAIIDIRADNFWGGGSKGQLRLRDSNDFIDLSSVTSRASRYKEYERLMYVAEIDAALTIFSDESCLVGSTLIPTPFGSFTIKELAETKKPDERFLVYSYDFEMQDYTYGWAFHPRLVKTAPTVKILLDNGKFLEATEDHKILLRNGEWKLAGNLAYGDELMPFYRIPANANTNKKLKRNQFPRIFSLHDGWKHERHFADEWRTGKSDKQQFTHVMRCMKHKLKRKELEAVAKKAMWEIEYTLNKEGFTLKETKLLNKRYKDRRRVIGIAPGDPIEVYDMSVEKHYNFATENCIVHNCQRGENGHVFDIVCKNQSVKSELEFLFFRLLKVDRKMWTWARRLYQMGDLFFEVIIDPENPKAGILKINALPTDSIYRIETNKGKIIEFQQSGEGPDYQSLSRVDVMRATDQDLAAATALRFRPEQIVHGRIGDERKTFYPYGVSLIEPARGPAHQLRLMEDSMVVYRLTRSPERRVFYIDMGTLPHNKSEAVLERIKDQLRKKKVYSSKSGQASGASSVEERWHAPAVDEDIWLPTRPNSNTRVETLPGACLTLDTEIPLLDGRTLALSQIIEEFKANKQLWAFSCCPNTGKIVPGKITWAGVTRKNTKILRITLDNGKTINCTPDHKFPVLNKGFVEAQDLKTDENLITFAANSTYVFENGSWQSIQGMMDHYLKRPIKRVANTELYSMGWLYWKPLTRIVKVEEMLQSEDTGTLTIDGKEELHDYHTFALAAGVFTKNSQLGEVDDVVYFRNKLLIALNMPRNYLNPDDPSITQKNLSAQDIRFARLVERLQMSLSDMMFEIAERHLHLRGFPTDTFDDLDIVLTPPSEYREQSRQEILQARYGNASTLKSAQIMSDYDIYVDILKISEEKAKDYVSRNKMQKIEDAKIQAMVANPELLGVGNGASGEDTELGAEAGGPSPMLGGGNEEEKPPEPEDKGGPGVKHQKPESQPIPNPTTEEIRKYDLAIKDYSAEKDEEELDQAELGDE